MIPESSSYIGADKHRSIYQAGSGLSIKMYEERLSFYVKVSFNAMCREI